MAEITNKPLLLEAVYSRTAAHAGGDMSPFTTDDNAPTEAVVDGMIDDAVLSFSDYRPRYVTFTYNGDGTVYNMSLLSTGVANTTLPIAKPWINGMSKMIRLEYPGGERHPITVDDNSWRFYPTYEDATSILMEDTPATGETVIMTYTTVHVVDETTCSVSKLDIVPLLYLCMGRYCEYVATFAAYGAGKTFDVEMEENTSSTSWRRLADMYYRQVDNAIGSNFVGNKDDQRFKGSKTSRAIGSRIDYDPKTGYGSLVWRSHKQR